ncbi:hypothetical protein KEH51_16930 [[Brevibacterium] frigoritolerans]|uniref:Uncharacterized protein n=1 Tax=Peribacillus frigoritolerans TaxID=450367 RepID=A0A941FRJ9_9BACI|nr:hypothetical protein [Peribacillus frigoritolerans]
MTENKNEEQILENETIEESAADAVFAEEEIPAAEENDVPVEKMNFNWLKKNCRT